MTEAVERSKELPDGEKIRISVTKFRSGLSTPVQRREAVRELADVMEFHRSKVVDRLLNKDESDLFQIINRFSIRHHNEHQRTEYGPEMLTWMFQVFLATSYLVLNQRS